ncbi:MAG: FG-GAP repeat protein, partial [Bacteroidota bacterium]
MKRAFFLGFLVFGLLVACNTNTENDQPASPTLFTQLTSAETGIAFNNLVENQKEFNVFKYRNFYNGGGVAIGDINNDGLPDIYMTANMEPNKLYINKGN